jgi:hypothetical protein
MSSGVGCVRVDVDPCLSPSGEDLLVVDAALTETGDDATGTDKEGED